MEQVGHTWHPIAKPLQEQRGTSTRWANPAEFARMRDGLLADGHDAEWVDWFLSGADDEDEIEEEG